MGTGNSGVPGTLIIPASMGLSSGLTGVGGSPLVLGPWGSALCWEPRCLHPQAWNNDPRLVPMSWDWSPSVLVCLQRVATSWVGRCKGEKCRSHSE